MVVGGSATRRKLPDTTKGLGDPLARLEAVMVMVGVVVVVGEEVAVVVVVEVVLKVEGGSAGKGGTVLPRGRQITAGCSQFITIFMCNNC